MSGADNVAIVKGMCSGPMNSQSTSSVSFSRGAGKVARFREHSDSAAIAAAYSAQAG